ncbi:MAG TPA: RimK family alpha-L-glutamate ligase [Desulfobacteria bacterium]|nr:RimK family alpha-L-glutamate ligase [Desulfobacteria bacterium]
MKGWIICKGKNRDSYENRRFQEVAQEEGTELEFYDPNDFDIITTKGGRKSLIHNGREVSLPDFVLPRMGSGTTYFGLAVIRQLERLKVPVINGAESIEQAKDKLHTLQILAADNLPTPKTMLARFPVNVDLIEKEFACPLIVKTLSGSEGKGVFLCENREHLEDLLDILNEARDVNVNFIIQEFVSSSKGKDIRVFVVGGMPIAAMLRKGKEGKFKANIAAGGSGEPYELNPEVEWLSVKASQLLNLDLAGVDILFDGEHFKVCEVNSAPGFEGLEKATGVNVPHQIYHYIRVRLGHFT